MSSGSMIIPFLYSPKLTFPLSLPSTHSVCVSFFLLQVVTNRDTQETLLCIAFVFEVSTSEHGAQHHVYKLVKD